MNKLIKFALVFLLGITVISCTPSTPSTGKFVDYASQLKLDFTSSSNKLEVQVKKCIDGDTTHFYVPTSVEPTGVFRARYLAIDTPESTGQIQPWGKAASDFNKSKLENAQSVYIESEDSNWNLDSTGERYMLWIWYRLNESDDYRLLNLEILQEGYAATKSYSSTRYGEIFGKAHNQAIALKLRYYGTDPDPDYDYGSYRQLTLKGLRENIEDLTGKNVRFEGTIVLNSSANTYMVEDYDEDTETYYGITVYSGYNFNGQFLLKVGNRLSFAGVLSYSEGFGYQVSSLTYYAMRPEHEACIRLISENNLVEPHLIDVDYFNANKTKIEDVYVQINNLTVTEIYTTTDETTSSVGAMTLTCQDENNQVIKVRTSVLYEEDGVTLVTEDAYINKTIDIVGTVDKYNDTYQIHVYFTKDIVVKN